MRKLLLLLAIALTVSLTGFAQAAGSSQSESTTSKTTSTTKTKEVGTAKESQLTGCLAKSADGSGYTLTNGKHTQGVAVKSSEDMSAHVGHQVKLMGTWESGKKTFDATSLKHISDTCTATAAGGKKGGKKAAAEKPPAS